MNSIIKSFIFISLSIISLQVIAQEELNLEKAIQMAMEKNHGIRVAHLNAETAKNNAHPGNAGLLPSVDLQGGYNYSKGNSNIEFAGGIPPTEVDGAVSTTLQGSVGASYLLFDGLGVIYNYQKLKEVGGLGETQAQLTIESTLLQVANLYYNIARLQENLTVSKEGLSISKERYERAKLRNEYGGPKIVMLNAQVDLNSDSIQQVTLSLNLKQLKRSLNTLIGRSPSTEYSVAKDVRWDENVALESVKQKAKENNTAILMAAHNMFISEVDLKSYRSNQYPMLLANASYGYTRQENDAGIMLSNTQLGFNGGITLSYSLFNGRRNHIQIQNAKVAIESSKTKFEEAQLNVERDVLNTWDNFTDYQQLLSLQELNLETAQVNFERTKELFDLGNATGTQFREAQLNLLRLQSQINDTRYSVKLAEIELKTLSGELLKN